MTNIDEEKEKGERRAYNDSLHRELSLLKDEIAILNDKVSRVLELQQRLQQQQEQDLEQRRRRRRQKWIETLHVGNDNDESSAEAVETVVTSFLSDGTQIVESTSVTANAAHKRAGRTGRATGATILKAALLDILLALSAILCLSCLSSHAPPATIIANAVYGGTNTGHLRPRGYMALVSSFRSAKLGDVLDNAAKADLEDSFAANFRDYFREVGHLENLKGYFIEACALGKGFTDAVVGTTATMTTMGEEYIDSLLAMIAITLGQEDNADKVSQGEETPAPIANMSGNDTVNRHHPSESNAAEHAARLSDVTTNKNHFEPNSTSNAAIQPTIIATSLFPDKCNGCVPATAIDGNIAVVAARSYLRFYSLTKDDHHKHDSSPPSSEWKLTQTVHIPTSQRMQIALSNNILAVGAYMEHSYKGAVYILERTDYEPKKWEKVARIQPDKLEHGAQFGWSLALDALHDNALVVGAPQDLSKKNGSVHVFRRRRRSSSSSSRHERLEEKLVSSQSSSSLFVWEQEVKLYERNDLNVREYGGAVAFHDGIIAVSDYYYYDPSTNRDQGAVFMYRYDDGINSWIKMGQESKGYDQSVYPYPTWNPIMNTDCDKYFGKSLAFSSIDKDNDYDDYRSHHGIMIGCPMKNEFSGAVYYYESRSSFGYVMKQVITPFHHSEEEGGSTGFGGFGGINIHDGTMIVGTEAAVHGKAYVFVQRDDNEENGDCREDHCYGNGEHEDERKYSIWKQVMEIENSSRSRYFGIRVAMKNGRALIGSRDDVHTYLIGDVWNTI